MTAGLEPYPKTKNSGVEWLGEVPAHWEVRRLKRICRMAYGDALADDMRRHGLIPVFGSNGQVGFHDSANTRAPCIVVGRKGSFGKVNYSHNPVFAIDTTFFVDNRFSSANIRWLFYFLGWLRLDEVTKDSAVPGLAREDAYRKLGVVPPLAEQAAIVRYLDYVDRRIRRCIRAKEKLIALLKEQKQAVIHEAVSGRIDVRTGRPYPTYKPSGMEWLGEVPAHWEVLPNRAIFAEVNEKNHHQEQMLSVTITDGVIRQRTLLEDSSKKDASRLDRSDYKLVQPGDIAYNKMRAWQGAIGVSKYRGIVSPAYVVQRPKNRLISRYLHYLMRTSAFATEAERWSYGITSDMWSLRPEHFKMIYSCVPSLAEQAAIVRYLDQTTAGIGAAVARTRRQIELFNEYRTRLIADVVSGKLDVREAAANLPDETDAPAPPEMVREAHGRACV